MELVVLDMAGTTVEDAGQVPRAFTRALAAHGLSLAPEELSAVRGASKREAIRLLLEERRPRDAGNAALAEEVFASFRHELAAALASEGVRSVPGAPETLAWLRGRGVRVALTTGFDRDTTDRILAALGWDRGVVDAVVCGDDVPRGRPAPYLVFRAMERTGATRVRSVAAVGDTVLDLEAGANAGAGLVVGVLSGAHSRERLLRAPHSLLLESVAELPAALEEYL